MDDYKNLFGEQMSDHMSPGELSVAFELAEKRTIMIDRSNWLYDHLDPVENILLDIEGHILFSQAIGCFINGMDAATIICSIAFIERLVTDAVEIRGEPKATSRGFGAVLEAAERLKLLHPFFISRLKHLNKVRVNFSHEKGPENHYTLFRRKMNFLKSYPLAEFPEYTLLQNDAREAICFCHLLAKRVHRYFPRFDLPGHPSIKEDLRNVGIFQV